MLSSSDKSLPNLTMKDDTETPDSHHQVDESIPTWLLRMRWFHMIGMLTVIIITPVACIIAFGITKSPYCFAPCSILIPPVWRIMGRITNYLFPQDTKDFELEIAKIFRMHRNKPKSTE